MSEHEIHEGCGGLVYAHHQGKEWYLFCQKCGLKTDIYDSWHKAKKAWYEMIEPKTESEK